MQDDTIERIPPVDLEAEMSLLGGLMVAQDGAAEIVDILEPEDFFSHVHEAIFTAIHNVWREKKRIDVPLLVQWLEAHGSLARVGGEEYLRAIEGERIVGSKGNRAAIISMARKIATLSVLRAIAEFGSLLQKFAYECDNGEEVIRKATPIKEATWDARLIRLRKIEALHD